MKSWFKILEIYPNGVQVEQDWVYLPSLGERFRFDKNGKTSWMPGCDLSSMAEYEVAEISEDGSVMYFEKI